MADTTLTVRQDDIWVIENPQYGIVGEIIIFSITVPYASSIGTSDTKAYRDGTEVSGDVLSGSSSTTTNVMTAETYTPDVAGRYVLWFKWENGTITENKQLMVIVKKAGAET